MDPKPVPPPMIWWVIWIAILSGVFIIHQVVVMPEKSPAADDSQLWLVAVVPLAIGTILRWRVLPRMTGAAAAFPVFIVGLVLAESVCMLGMFVFRDHGKELLVLGVLGIIQFMPLFAKRFSAA